MFGVYGQFDIDLGITSFSLLFGVLPSVSTGEAEIWNSYVFLCSYHYDF